MNGQIPDYKFHPLSEAYPLMSDAELDRLAENIHRNGLQYPVEVWKKAGSQDEEVIIDGRNRYLACKRRNLADALKVKLCRCAESDLPAKIESLNEHRRHLTGKFLEQIQKSREKRIERVAKKRQKGMSLRAIAEEEGVSLGQIQQDLQQAIVYGYTIEPESGRVERSGGGTYPASRPSQPAVAPSAVNGSATQPAVPVNNTAPVALPMATDAKPDKGKLVGYITLPEWEAMSPDEREAAIATDDEESKFNNQGGNDNIEWALWSWNPVTGCRHNCPYCLDPDTLILYADMVWRRIGDVRIGDVLVGFDEYPSPGKTRKLRPSVVENVWLRKRPTIKLTTPHGEVIATAEHLWLDGSRWRRTEQLRRAGGSLRYIGPFRHGVFHSDTDPSVDYRSGYITGMTIGDGTFRYLPEQRYDRSAGPEPYWRVALADSQALVRLSQYLAWFDITAPIRPFNSGPNGGSRPMQKVETRCVESLQFIHNRIREAFEGDGVSPDFRRGILAGFFDAEGSSSGGNLRMKQKDVATLQRIQALAAQEGFAFKLEQFPGELCATLRLTGSLRERLRFFGVCQPAITRKMESVFGLGLDMEASRITATEDCGVRDVVDIQTSTRTFFANGFATHNCYARDIAERFYEQKFEPSLWPARLNAPENTKFPQEKASEWMGHKNVFTCSMADLFGRWVPKEWIDAVLNSVRSAPQWNFLFLTKFPQRMAEFKFPDNAWAGTTVDCQARVANAEKAFRKIKAGVKWLSCEPLIEPLKFKDIGAFNWVVLGGSSKSSQTPEWHPPRDWANAIEAEARKAGVRVYEKSNLLQRIREYPGVEINELTEAPQELRYLPS